MGAFGIAGYRTIYEHRAYTTTEKRIERVFYALAQHVKRTGSLPCPVTPDNQGVAPIGLVCAQNVGGVPYATLGMRSLDVEDGWQRLLVYSVDPSLSSDRLATQADEVGLLSVFCAAQPSTLNIKHSLGQATLLHPAVVLLSHGPTGPRADDAAKAYNAAATMNFVDQSPDSTFDDIVRFVTRDNLLPFYGQAGCPVQAH